MDFQQLICWHWCMNDSTVEGVEFILILKALHPFLVILGV